MRARSVLVTVGLLAVIATASVLWLGGNLNSIVKKGVERYGPRVTKTDVHLAGVDLRLKEGRGTLLDLRIANPEGFSGADAISLGEITLDIDPGSLTRQPIVVETIRIVGPSLRLEVAEDGAVNLRSLQKSVNTYSARLKDHSGDDADRSPPPRVVVRELTVEGGTLALDTTTIGGESTERALGSFTLRDLGGSEGVPADQMGQEVLLAILHRAVEQGARDELKRAAQDALAEAGAFLGRIAGD